MRQHLHTKLTGMLQRRRDGSTVEVQICLCRATRVVVVGPDGAEHPEAWVSPAQKAEPVVAPAMAGRARSLLH